MKKKVTFEVDAELYWAFKGRCMMERTSVSAILNEMISSYVELAPKLPSKFTPGEKLPERLSEIIDKVIPSPAKVNKIVRQVKKSELCPHGIVLSGNCLKCQME